MLEVNYTAVLAELLSKRDALDHAIAELEKYQLAQLPAPQEANHR